MENKTKYRKYFICTKYLLALNILIGIGFLLSCNVSDPSILIDKGSFAGVINNKQIPSDLNDELSRTIFSNYAERATVTARYVTTNGTGDGTSWANATNDLQGAIDSINGASINHIYVVLVASGTYTNASSYSMKDYVAIVGGFTAGSYNRVDETQLDGNRERRVFNNNNQEKSALLYGLTIANGNTNNNGGGMYNQNSSPTLINVTFFNNKAVDYGGGMFNDSSSSPTLIEVVFSGNTANNGGGMYNNDSSPTLIEVVFSSNTAASGGGMFNINSSPTLSRVTFSDNIGEANGGGMYNQDSSPTLIGVTFFTNRALGGKNDSGGGGMFNQNSSLTLIGVTFFANTANTWGGGMLNGRNSSPILIGVTFSGNTAGFDGGGMLNAEKNSSPILINTLIWGNSSSNSNSYNKNISGDTGKIYYSLIEGVINTNNGVITNDPGDLVFSNHGGAVKTISILGNSAAKDKGVYVRGVKNNNNYTTNTLYVSTNMTFSTNMIWYQLSDLTTAVTQLADADNLTTTDARGYRRVGRPDIGTFEVEGRP